MTMFYTIADALQQRVIFWGPPPKYWRSAFSYVLRQPEGIKLISIFRWTMQGRIALLTAENLKFIWPEKRGYRPCFKKYL